MERGNGCNHLSAFASAPFITDPDVVLVVDASVVFNQFPPKSLQVVVVVKGGGGGQKQGKWVRVIHTNKTIIRCA